MHGRTVFTITPTLTASAVNYLFNTTGHGIAPTATTYVGDSRGMWRGGRYTVPHIIVGDQAITIAFKVLNPQTGLWVAMPSANIPTGYSDGGTLSASTTYEGFSIVCHDEIFIYTTNGGTGPNALDFGSPYWSADIAPGV